MASRSSQVTTESLALVLGKVPFGDTDLIVQLFTERYGKLSALARGIRKNQRRFAGSMEPLHTLRVELIAPGRGELYSLKSSHIDKPRPNLMLSLDRLTAAGRAISWSKRATSPHVAEPGLWESLNQTLDQVSQAVPQHADDVIASFGLRLLELMGWGINFLHCVSCGRPCPEQRSAWVNPERGGLVCRACGGGPFQISAPDRLMLHRIASGEEASPPPEIVVLTIKIVERALGAHMGWEDGGGMQDLGQRFKS